MQLTVRRTKRYRDAYKAADAAHRIASKVDLRAVAMIQDEKGCWCVRFRLISGMMRSKPKKIPPFWDTDLATALIEWNKEHGGSGTGTGCTGSVFYTPNHDDALMMRLAFS